MLIQYHRDWIRLIAQHHHSLVSGELAAHWRGFESEAVPLDYRVVLATALHDLSWLRADDSPLFDAQAGKPYDFQYYPQAPRLEFYSQGLDGVSAIHPFAGLLGSMHYSTFESTQAATEFQAHERLRRDHLKAILGPGETSDEALINDLAWLKLFDRLSLFICLTTPSIPEPNRPSWLGPGRFASTPAGRGFRPEWEGASTMAFEPFPFDRAFQVSIPYRDVQGRHFQSEAAWREAWNRASTKIWNVQLKTVDKVKEVRR